MKKYIIKNCENLVYCPSCKTYECGLCLQGDDYRRKCEDNTNCRLKQIVNLCKISNKYSQKQYKEDDLTAKHILRLLDIQEVEE